MYVCFIVGYAQLYGAGGYLSFSTNTSRLCLGDVALFRGITKRYPSFRVSPSQVQFVCHTRANRFQLCSLRRLHTRLGLKHVEERKIGRASRIFRFFQVKGVSFWRGASLWLVKRNQEETLKLHFRVRHNPWQKTNGSVFFCSGDPPPPKKRKQKREVQLNVVFSSWL